MVVPTLIVRVAGVNPSSVIVIPVPFLCLDGLVVGVGVMLLTVLVGVLTVVVGVTSVVVLVLGMIEQAASSSSIAVISREKLADVPYFDKCMCFRIVFLLVDQAGTSPVVTARVTPTATL